MNSNFKDAIKLIEEKALNNFEKGKAFEKLCKVFFEILTLEVSNIPTIPHIFNSLFLL